MKTVWEVIVVITCIGLFVAGMTSLGDQIFETQTLSIESVNTLSTYSTQADAFLQNYSTALNRSEIDPYLETDLNDVDGFVQEYRDYKGRLDQLKDGLLLIYKVPDLIFNLVPGVSPEDLGIYVNAYRFLIWVFLLLILLVALRGNTFLPQG